MIMDLYCKLFGHTYDIVNSFDLSYHCRRCDQWYRGILPRGKLLRDYNIYMPPRETRNAVYQSMKKRGNGI